MNMDKVALTMILPLRMPVEAEQSLLETLEQYTDSYNRVCQTGWGLHRINGVEIHHLTYAAESEMTDLPAQLVCSARVKATESLKSARARLKQGQKARCPRSQSCSIRYDQRSMNIKLTQRYVTLATIRGRVRAELLIPPHWEKRLDWKTCSADLCRHRNGRFYLHLVAEKSFEAVAEERVVGVDLGVNRPAVTSAAHFFGQRCWKAIDSRYFRLKRALQAKGTDSAKRHLKRLAQKENRFRRDCDHVLSKRLAQTYGAGTLLVLEDLTDIRTRVKARKQQRRRIHRWSFSRLKGFLEYKAPMFGCQIAFVDPRYTSQKCSKCEHIEKRNRKSQSEFCCKKCGFRHNADLNAAKNICQNYLAQRSMSSPGGPPSTGLS